MEAQFKGEIAFDCGFGFVFGRTQQVLLEQDQVSHGQPWPLIIWLTWELVAHTGSGVFWTSMRSMGQFVADACGSQEGDLSLRAA